MSLLCVPEKVNYKAKRTQALSGFLGNIREELGKAEEITLTSTEMQIYMWNVFPETQRQYLTRAQPSQEKGVWDGGPQTPTTSCRMSARAAPPDPSWQDLIIQITVYKN